MDLAGNGQGLHNQPAALWPGTFDGGCCQASLPSCCCAQLQSAGMTASEPAIQQGMDMLPSICQVFSPTLQLPSCCNEQAMLPTMRASGQRILISLPWPVQKPCCACRLARLAPQQGRCSTGSCSTWLQTWKPRSLLSRSVLSLRPACSPCMCHVCHGRAWSTVSGPRRCSCRCRAALCMESSECCPVAHVFPVAPLSVYWVPAAIC